jgi:chromosome segregation ATPase
MTVHIHIAEAHVYLAPESLDVKLDNIATSIQGLKMDMATALQRLTDLAGTVANIQTEVDKVGGETDALVAEVANLKAVIAAGAVTTPEVDAALAAVEARASGLAAAVQAVDDKVPDPVTITKP